MENYLIVIEQAENNYSAYSPDIDGCIATGDTPEEARKNYLEALEFHIEGLIEEGFEIPKAVSRVAFCAEDCTGVLNVRVKKSVHYGLINLAEKEGVSVSHLVNDALVEKYSNPKIERINNYNVEDSLSGCVNRLKRTTSKKIARTGINPSKCNMRKSGYIPKLSERELEVLALVVQGESTNKIATQLSLSNETVKNQIHKLSQIMNKLEEITMIDCPKAQA